MLTTLSAIANRPCVSGRTIRHRHRGVSLVEVLVVMGIIALLIGLLGPSVQRARESARAVECRNRLRQIGVALASFETQQQGFPPRTVRRTEFIAPEGPELPVSLHYSLLPHIGQTSLWEQVQLNGESALGRNADPARATVNTEVMQARVALWLCPSETSSAARVNYRASTGTTPQFHTTSDDDAFHGARAGFRLARDRRRVTDGSSQTIFVAERVAGDQTAGGYDPFRDVAHTASEIRSAATTAQDCALTPAHPTSHASFLGTSWLAESYGQTLYNHILGPNSTTPDCCSCSPGEAGNGGAYSARSLHAGVVHTLYGDGAVTAVNQSIDLRLWRALGTIAEADPTNMD